MVQRKKGRRASSDSLVDLLWTARGKARRRGRKRGDKRGGAREGAGRKRLAPRPQVAHRKRTSVSLLEPLHVTVRVRADVPSLRQRAVNDLLREIFCAMKVRAGFKILQYSIQGNHIHMIVEAECRASMSSGMTSLMTRIARRLNKFFGRVGRFFADRYHMVSMRTPKQVRRTLVCVFGNARHHHAPQAGVIDDYTSGAWYGEWQEKVTVRGLEGLECPVERHEAWLMHGGMVGLGRISVYERPR